MAKRGRKSLKEIMEKGIEIDWSTYGSIYSKKSKYKKGEAIKDLDTLMKQKVIIFVDMCRNIDWVLSQQLRWILRFLKEGCIYYAIPKNKEEIKGGSNDKTDL